jgi:hypothetical protein
MYSTVMPRNISSVKNNPDGNIACICEIHIKTNRVQNSPNYHYFRRMDRITHGPRSRATGLAAPNTVECRQHHTWISVPLTQTHRLHIFTRDETGLVCLSAQLERIYTATLLMVNVMKRGGRAPPTLTSLG